MPVRVPVGLLESHVAGVLPVAPVLLAQPGLLAHADLLGVQMKRLERLVRTAVRRDVDADALSAEDVADAFAGLLSLLPAEIGERESVVGLALVHGVINIAR